MSLLSKFRPPQPSQTGPRPGSGRDHGSSSVPTAPLHAPAVRNKPESVAQLGRFSNGLKQFLWQLDDIGRGKMLDLGPVSQATLNFFIERGFKVYTEDLLSSWTSFARAEEEMKRQQQAGGSAAQVLDPSPAARAERFLAANLRHAPDTFDAVLLWDLLDYFDRDVASHVARRLATMVRENGAILAVFHAKIPAPFQHYRVLDDQNLELVPAAGPAQPLHVYQNREIQELFEGFRSSKTFVGRDQLREGVFIK